MNKHLTPNMRQALCSLQPTITVLVLLIYLLLPAPVVAASLSPPTTQQFIEPYTAPVTPVVSSTASSAKPVAFGDIVNGGESMKLQIQTATFTSPMDAYLLFSIPTLTGNSLILIDEYGNIQFLESGFTPWKRGIRSINEEPLGEIPTDLLPGDNYTVYLLLTESGSLNYYYLWAATMSLKPTILQFAETLINKFPDEVDAPLAILLSFNQGYSLQQIVEASMKGLIDENGVLTDASGRKIEPTNEALGIITDNREKRSFNDRSKKTYTKQEVENTLTAMNEKLIDLLVEDSNTNGGMVSNSDEVILIMSAIIVAQQIVASHSGLTDISPDDVLYSLFEHYAVVQEKRIAMQNKIDRTAFLQNSRNYIQIYDGPPDDEASKPLPVSSEIKETFRNSPPTALDSSLFAIQGQATDVILYADDPDTEDENKSTTLKYEVMLNPKHGTLSGSGDLLSYKSNSDFTGTDSFTFHVSDGERYSNEAIVEIEVKEKEPVLVLDKVILTKYNGSDGDKCPDSTPESTEICAEYERSSSGSEYYTLYSLNSNTAIYKMQDVYVGLLNQYHDVRSDYLVTFTFDSPPERITPGEKLPRLKIEGKAEGYTAGGYYERGFVYYYAYSNSSNPAYFEDTDIYLLNRNLPYNEETGRFEGPVTDFSYTDITVPLTAGDGFTIGGKFGWDPGFYIQWIYKLESYD